jgi:two-component system OmpR family response regulator
MRQHQSQAISTRVLCVDDDRYLTDLLHYALSRDGYTVEVASSGADSLRSAQAAPPDVVVLDVHLPDISGFTLCGRFRTDMRLPVIMLTASSLESDIVVGFQQGADDYVSKPFSMEVLSYRIRAVLRHRAPDPAGGSARAAYPLGSGRFDAEQHEVVGAKVRVKLTPIQGKILRVLLENEGRALSAEQLMSKVWHYDVESDLSVVKTHICNLRKQIARALGEGDLIHSVPGVGYSLRQPPRDLPRVALGAGS